MSKPSAGNKSFDKTAITVVVITGIFGLISLLVTHYLDGNKNDAIKEPIIINNNPENKVVVSLNSAKDTIVANATKPINNPVNRKEPKATLQTKTYMSRVIDSTGTGIADVEIYCQNCLTKKIVTSQDGSFSLKANFFETEILWVTELTFSKQKTSFSKNINWREQSPQPIKIIR